MNIKPKKSLKKINYVNATFKDDILHLPPIEMPPLVDPFSQHPLMKHSLNKKKNASYSKDRLNKATKLFFKYLDDSQAKSNISLEPSFPLQSMSLKHQNDMNKQQLLKCINGIPIADLQNDSLQRIMNLIDSKFLKQNLCFFRDILVEEIKSNYIICMKNCTITSTLARPNDRSIFQGSSFINRDHILENWKTSFIKNQRKIKLQLKIMHPSLQKVLSTCQILKDKNMINYKAIKYKMPLNSRIFKNFISNECDSLEENIMTSWFPQIIKLIKESDCLKLNGITKNDYSNCLNTLISIVMRNLLHESLISFTEQFIPFSNSLMKKRIDVFDNSEIIFPILHVSLAFEDGQIIFYPDFDGLLQTLWQSIDKISGTLQLIPSIESCFVKENSSIFKYLICQVDHEILNFSKVYIKNLLENHFVLLNERLNWFNDQYGSLFHGEALREIQEILSQNKSFEENLIYSEKFFKLTNEITIIPTFENIGMLQLDCTDIKNELIKSSNNVQNEFLCQLAIQHKDDSLSICNEFKTIYERGCQEPQTSEELVELINYFEVARNSLLPKIMIRIVSFSSRLKLLLDKYIFLPEDLELNAAVILWPKKKKVPTATLR